MNYLRTASISRFILLLMSILLVCSVVVCGVYFSDENQEKIGVLDGGEIVTLAAFSPIQFAYRDEIDFLDGKVYWVRETTDTEPSEAKYVLVAYNCASGDSDEYKNVFFFNVNSNGLITLNYDGKENFERVDLFNY